MESPKSSLDPELVKSLGLGGKGMPNIKGVIQVDPKHMPNLTTGKYGTFIVFTVWFDISKVKPKLSGKCEL